MFVQVLWSLPMRIPVTAGLADFLRDKMHLWLEHSGVDIAAEDLFGRLKTYICKRAMALPAFALFQV